jgi:outer membrane lipoprotein carrier protein
MKFLFPLVFLFTTFAVQATPTEDFTSLLNKVHSMQASFTQTTLDAHGKATQKASGQMALERPGKFRWDVKKPMPQLIIANASKLWIYDPDLEQVTIRSLKNAAGESPALLLSHDDSNLENTYNVEAIQKNTNQRWFSLTPKKKDNLFESIQMGFANNQIEEMQLNDNLGHTTLIQFKDIKLNQALSASLFSFNPSKKIDVIDETIRKK